MYRSHVCGPAPDPENAAEADEVWREWLDAGRGCDCEPDGPLPLPVPHIHDRDGTAMARCPSCGRFQLWEVAPAGHTWS